MTTPAIRTEKLRVVYGSTVALDDVSVTMRAGAMTGVMGPNGSGKSSLLKAIVGAIPSRGAIVVEGARGPTGAGAVAYVPQESAIDLDFPVTVRDVVAQGRVGRLGLFRRPSAADRDAIASALDRVGLAELSDRPIGALSGGQRQRAFLARALAQEASILLLDEPFAGVDAATEAAFVDVMRELRDSGHAIVVVHHALGTARAYFDDLILLNTRLIAQGGVAETFTPSLLREAYGGEVAVFEAGQG